MAGWHHQLNGHEFEWTQGVGDGQGGLWCCDSWGRKELDMTEHLKTSKIKVMWTQVLQYQDSWLVSPVKLGNSSTLATSCEELTHWKRLWWCEGLGAGGKGDDRGLDGWMASRTWWFTQSLSGLWELMMDREAWCAVIHGVTKSRTRLSDWTELSFHKMLWNTWMNFLVNPTYKIGKSGVLQSMGSQRVGHDLVADNKCIRYI